LRRTVEPVIADPPRGATVIVEESGKTLTSANAADMLHRRLSLNQLIVQALVIPFAMVVLMLNELGVRCSSRAERVRAHVHRSHP